MTDPRLARAALLATLALVLAACSSGPAPAALNGTYVGDMFDPSGAYLGSHAMDVATSGSSFSGDYCFAATTGEVACNFVAGSVTGTSDTGSVHFSVGTVDYRGTVTNDREIRGSYAFDGGSGAFDMSWDPTASTTALAPLAVVDGSKNDSPLAGALRGP